MITKRFPMFCLFLVIALAGLFCAEGEKEEQVFSMRVYKGFREVPPAVSDSSGSYKRIEISETIGKGSVEAEKKKLMLVFNLREVHLVGEGVLQKRKSEQGQLKFVFSRGEKLATELQATARKDFYRLFASNELGKRLLEAELVIPPEQGAIVGFEAPDGSLLFILVQRENSEKPRIMKKVDPVYPPEAREKKISGTVVLEFMIDESGVPGEIRVVEGPEILAAASIQALKQWRYQPLMIKGKPKKTVSTITLIFRLK